MRTIFCQGWIVNKFVKATKFWLKTGSKWELERGARSTKRKRFFETRDLENRDFRDSRFFYENRDFFRDVDLFSYDPHSLVSNFNHFLIKIFKKISANPCSVGVPLRDSQGNVGYCSSEQSKICPANYYCHIGGDATTSLCCPEIGKLLKNRHSLIVAPHFIFLLSFFQKSHVVNCTNVWKEEKGILCEIIQGRNDWPFDTSNNWPGRRVPLFIFPIKSNWIDKWWLEEGDTRNQVFLRPDIFLNPAHLCNRLLTPYWPEIIIHIPNTGQLEFNFIPYVTLTYVYIFGERRKKGGKKKNVGRL